LIDNEIALGGILHISDGIMISRLNVKASTVEYMKVFNENKMPSNVKKCIPEQAGFEIVV